MKTRGLFLALDYPPMGGGVSRLLGAWIRSTPTLEWRVVTSALGPEVQGVRRVNHPSGLPAAGCAELRWLKSADRRLVVAGHPYLSGLAAPLALAAQARSGCVAYGRELVPMRAPHYAALAPLRLLGRLVAISRATADAALALGVASQAIRVLPPNIEAPWLAAAAPTRKAGVPLTLAVISRLAESYKNIELAIRIVAVLPPQTVNALMVIGSGPRLESLRQTARDLGVADRVTFTGRLEDAEIAAVLCRCHVGLFPSVSSPAAAGFEGFGLVVHEFGAAGLPVLAGRAAGASDASRAPWARLLDPWDLLAWVEAIDDMAKTEPARRSHGEAALNWIASRREASADLLEEALCDGSWG